jgi:predicted RNase H-like HicB family nuclease
MATAEVGYEIGEIHEATEVVYHCNIAMIREEDGSYTAIVLNLPGAASEGATEDEAMANVRESICGLVESYTATGDPIPWKDPVPCDVPPDAKTKWILVYV